MLGSTAGGLFWMFRYLERSENTARLLEAGLRMSLTRASASGEDWRSVLTTSGAEPTFRERFDDYDLDVVVDFLLRDQSHPSSVLSSIELARTSARSVRAALTREVWEATNESWISLQSLLTEPVDRRELPTVLAHIRRQSALVRGAMTGTMMRNDIYDFCRLGTFVERADSTARILGVKYYLLLPSSQPVGSRLDNVQWDNILRSMSVERAYRWRFPGAISARDIAEFVIFDTRMPRSLAFCYKQIYDKLAYLADLYGERHICHAQADELRERFLAMTVDAVFEQGLHEFLEECISEAAGIANQIELDYGFAS